MTVLYVVQVEVSPDRAAEWDKWHTEVHVPEVLAEPGFLRCTKFRDTQEAADGWMRFVTHFELESRAAFDAYTNSAAAARLRAESLKHFDGVTRYERALYEQTARFDAARA